MVQFSFRTVQELAADMEDGDPAYSRKKRPKGKGAASKPRSIAKGEQLYLLKLHEKHQLDEPEAPGNKGNDEFAGMQQVNRKGNWKPPSLPM